RPERPRLLRGRSGRDDESLFGVRSYYSTITQPPCFRQATASARLVSPARVTASSTLRHTAASRLSAAASLIVPLTWLRALVQRVIVPFSAVASAWRSVRSTSVQSAASANAFSSAFGMAGQLTGPAGGGAGRDGSEGGPGWADLGRSRGALSSSALRSFRSSLREISEASGVPGSISARQ